MDFTYEELREEGKRNIEIIESCAKKTQELSDNISNINSTIDMIKQGELNRQIESIKEQMEAFNKINSLFDNDNEEAKEVLLEKKERLSKLEELLQNNNESELQMLERKKEELEQEKLKIETAQNDAIELMKNIVEICDEYVETLEHEIDGKKTKQNAKSTQFGEIIEQYAKLEEELESYNKFNGFLTRKQQERINDIESEKGILEEKLVKVMPNLKKEILNKVKASQLDAKFEAMEMKTGRAIDRKTTIINSYKKVANELIDYLKDNKKEEFKTEKQPEEINNEPIEEEKIEKQEQLDEINNESVAEEKAPAKEETTSKDSYAVEMPWEILNKKDDIDIENTDIQEYNKPVNEKKQKIKTANLTDKDWNKNESYEFEYFFGTSNEKDEEMDGPIPEDKIEDLIYDQDNPKDIVLEEPLTTEELEQLSHTETNNTNKEPEDNIEQHEQPENESEPTVASYNSEIEEFAKIIMGETKEEPTIDSDEIPVELNNEVIEELKKENSGNENDTAVEDYIEELRKNSQELEIDKKTKRKVSKEKKQGRIKRIYESIKDYFFGYEEIEEIEEKEKGGRTK